MIPRGCFASMMHWRASTVPASMRPRGVVSATARVKPWSAGMLFRETRRKRIFWEATDQSLQTRAQDARVLLLSSELPLPYGE